MIATMGSPPGLACQMHCWLCDSWDASRPRECVVVWLTHRQPDSWLTVGHLKKFYDTHYLDRPEPRSREDDGTTKPDGDLLNDRFIQNITLGN